MQLIDLTVKGFIEVLGSDAPAPGGGSVSALCGANGAALAAMVARLTISKAKYAEFAPLMEEVIGETEKLQASLTAAIDRDTDAFNLVSAAFKMPKETDEEKKARSAKIAEGMVVSTKVPLETMELSLKTLEVMQKMQGKFNTNAASDLGVAALNLSAAVRGAWLNVLINLGSLKDASFAEECRTRGIEIEKKACQIADEIYTAIAASLS